MVGGGWTAMISGRLREIMITPSTTAPNIRAYAHGTAPMMKPAGQHHEAAAAVMKKQQRWVARGEFMPVYVALGMITVAVTLGLYTAKEQIMHAPNVRVRKRERERVGEVVEPDRVAVEGDKFVKGSFFRKVAHVQEFDPSGIAK